MYEQSVEIINPDPSKFALCEDGLQRLPRQCKLCKDLFTPVNDDQIGCHACEPNAVVVPVDYVRQPKIVSKINREWFKRTTPEYAYYYKICKGRARSKPNRAKGDDIAKWGTVHETLKRLYKARAVINYDDVVKEVFGRGDETILRRFAC